MKRLAASLLPCLAGACVMAGAPGPAADLIHRPVKPTAQAPAGPIGFSLLGANLDAQLQQLAVKASQGSAPKGSPAQQVGDYYRAFGTRPGDAMWRKPADRLRIW